VFVSFLVFCFVKEWELFGLDFVFCDNVDCSCFYFWVMDSSMVYAVTVYMFMNQSIIVFF